MTASGALTRGIEPGREQHRACEERDDPLIERIEEHLLRRHPARPFGAAPTTMVSAIGCAVVTGNAAVTMAVFAPMRMLPARDAAR